MFAECLLLLVLGQCPPVCQAPIELCPIEHCICNLNEIEQSRFYIQIRLIDGQNSYPMSIPVINGITPTVTTTNYTVFILDYAKKTSRSMKYDSRVIDFSPIAKSRTQLQRRRLIDLPPPRVQPQIPRAPLVPIPRAGFSIQDRMQRPSDIK